MRDERIHDPERVAGKAPGFWFFPGDYERDTQMLSLSTQGLWMRMLCWMHCREEHRGFLELGTGLPMTECDIAARAGKPLREIQKAIAEMERIGIFSRDERGCIYSRRMARDTHISEVRRAAAMKRHQAEQRACSEVAGGFAPAKHAAKNMQNAAVSGAVSDSVSDSVLDSDLSGARALVSKDLEKQNTEAPESWRTEYGRLYDKHNPPGYRADGESEYYSLLRRVHKQAVTAAIEEIRSNHKAWMQYLDDNPKEYRPGIGKWFRDGYFQRLPPRKLNGFERAFAAAKPSFDWSSSMSGAFATATDGRVA